MQITPLLDGIAVMPADTFPTRPAGAGETFALPIHAFLLRAPGLVALVDTGSAGNFGPGTGQCAQALAAAGVAPEQVSLIFLTHLHSDHFGGLTDASGAARFPNARLVLSRVELDALPMASEAARRALAAYDGRISGLSDGEPVAEGLRMLPLPGHTPGHAGLVAADGTVIAGDIFHNAVWQASNPGLFVKYDHDGPRAAATRLALLSELAGTQRALYAAHLAGGGPYRVTASGAGFAVDSPRPLA